MRVSMPLTEATDDDPVSLSVSDSVDAAPSAPQNLTT